MVKWLLPHTQRPHKKRRRSVKTKRVFRLRGNGNMKNIGLRGAGTYPQVEDLNARLTLIQGLIPSGS